MIAFERINPQATTLLATLVDGEFASIVGRALGVSCSTKQADAIIRELWMNGVDVAARLPDRTKIGGPR